MRPDFLLPETTVRDAGTGPVIDLREAQSGTLFLTFGITRIVEKESIELAIWGSADGANWGTIPLAFYPRKSYCGVYQLQLDLKRRSDVKYLRAQWDVNRWGRAAEKPLFTLYVLVETTDRQLAYATA